MLKRCFRKTHTEYTIGTHLMGIFWWKPYATIRWRFIVIRAFILKRKFWVGLTIGLFMGFLFAWFTVWATYIALEKQSKALATDLQQIKHIMLMSDSMEQERLDIIEWNQRTIKPRPTVVVAGEEQ